MNRHLAACRTATIMALALALASCAPPKPKLSPRLAWAYPQGPTSIFPLSLSGPQGVPGSVVTLTAEQLAAAPPDWFPAEHPPAPPIVIAERKSGPTPCAECHMVEGQGYPGAADLGGLSADYIVEQVHEFRSGRRRSAQADRQDTIEMTRVAEQVGEQELAEAAAYFAALPRRTLIRVVETDTVPRTTPDKFGWLNAVPGGAREPIAGRIIELPEDIHRMDLADPHMTVIDYAPFGAVVRGEKLVRTGGPGGQACRSCHGSDLRGSGAAPPLAGRSATYLARMLWDIKTGARGGPAVAAMQAPVAKLDEAQITDIVAYLAARAP